MAMLVSWSSCTLIGQVSVINVPWVNPHHERGPQDQVTALAKRGTKCTTMERMVSKLMCIFLYAGRGSK